MQRRVLEILNILYFIRYKNIIIIIIISIFLNISPFITFFFAVLGDFMSCFCDYVLFMPWFSVTFLQICWKIQFYRFI